MSRKNAAEEQGVVFVWGDDDGLFAADELAPAAPTTLLPPEETVEVPFTPPHSAPSIYRTPVETIEEDAEPEYTRTSEEEERRSRSWPRHGEQRSRWGRSARTSTDSSDEGESEYTRTSEIEEAKARARARRREQRAARFERQERQAQEAAAEAAQSENTLFSTDEGTLLSVAPPTEETPYRRVSLEKEAADSAASFETDEDGYLKKRQPSRKKPERSLMTQAVDYLSRREYARKELKKKLMFGVNSEEREAKSAEVDEVLDKLESLGYLSDARFAQAKVRFRASQMGNAKIRRELRQLGVAEEDIATAFEEIAEPEEVRAYRVWARRFSELPTDRKERERQIRYLLYRGFSMSAVERVIRGRVEPPEDQGIWD